ncbi:APO protein 3 [Arachis hypogaea]|nr:APO protein 3 [Arachis hypogaea]
MRAIAISSEIISHLKRLPHRFNATLSFSSETSPLVAFGDDRESTYSDVPRPCRRKSERKPYVTPMKVLIERAKKEREAPRNSLVSGLSQLARAIPGLRCELCNEVHIVYVGHEIRTCIGPRSGSRSTMHVWRGGGARDVVFFPKCFHLYDRVGKPRVGHDERFSVPHIPAIVELCIQAGVDFAKYPTKGRTKPVYCIEGRIVDFESVVEEVENKIELSSKNTKALFYASPELARHVENLSNLVMNNSNLDGLTEEERNKVRDLSSHTLEAWFEMISGAKKMMEKYGVNTCGYFPKVQVGLEGHKLRMRKASKHQSRNGLHVWQEATIIDDLVGPNYVWHVDDLNGSPLNNNLKRYYGKAPAVVELCVHGGALVPNKYKSMMRLDVVSPDRDEVDLVA